MNKEELLTICREIADHKYTLGTGFRKINRLLKAQNQELLKGKKQLAKEMAEERVKAEIESYNEAKQELLEKIETLSFVIGENVVKTIKQRIKKH